MNKDEALLRLYTIGAVLAEVDYDGGSDDGGYGDIRVYTRRPNYQDGATDPGSLIEISTVFQRELGDYAWDLTLEHYGYWYDGGLGAVGTVSFDVGAGTVKIEHNWRVEEYDTVYAEIE